MFSFFSNVATVVFGGGDDSLFDLATVEDLIQGLRDDHPDNDTTRCTPDNELPQKSTQPIIGKANPSQHGSLGTPLENPCPLPEEEQAIVDLRLPAIGDISVTDGKDFTGPDQDLRDAGSEQLDLHHLAISVVTSDGTGAYPATHIKALDSVTAAPAGHYAFHTNELGTLSPAFGHILAESSGEIESDETAVDSDRTSGHAVAEGVGIASFVDITEERTASKQSRINPFRSLKDIVQETKLDDGAEVIFFDDTQSVDVFHDAASVLSGMAGRQGAEPVTAGQDTSAKDATSPINEYNTSGQKERRWRGHRCKECGERGHIRRNCPTAAPRADRGEEESLPAEPAESPGELTRGSLTIMPAVPQSLGSSSDMPQPIPNWLSEVFEASTLAAEHVRDSPDAMTGSQHAHTKPVADFQAEVLQPESAFDTIRLPTSTEGDTPSVLRLLGPLDLTNIDVDQNSLRLFGPSYLTAARMALVGGGATQDTRAVDDKHRDTTSNFEKTSFNFFQPSTLTDKQHKLLFGVLGPQFLTQDEFTVGQPENEHMGSVANSVSNDTPVNPTGIVGFIRHRLPWLRSRNPSLTRYTIEELLNLRLPIAAKQPTGRIGEGYYLVAHQSKVAGSPQVTTRSKAQPSATVKVPESKTRLPPTAVLPATREVQGSTKPVSTGGKVSTIQQTTFHKRTAPQKQPKKPKQPKSKQAQPKQIQFESVKESEAKDVSVKITNILSKGQKKALRNAAEAARLPPRPFTCFTEPHIEAWSYASMVYASPEGKLVNEFGAEHLVMWTDATAPDENLNKRSQALSVTYQQPRSRTTAPAEEHNIWPSHGTVFQAADEQSALWRDWAFTADVDGSAPGRPGGDCIINILETMAVEVAVRIAQAEVDKLRDSHTPIRKVTVFTDSQHALTTLRNHGHGRPIDGYASRLKELGVRVELRWVPGHARVLGNERADRLALLASRYAPDPETKGGMVRVPVPLLRACEQQVARMEAWSRGANADVLLPFVQVQKRELKEALRLAGREEGWFTGR